QLKMSANPSAPPLSPTCTSPKDPLSGRLQQLGEELQCPLCIDYYEDPVALLCQHSFCRGCIRRAVRPRRGEAQEVECPLCRVKTQLVGSADTCVQKLPRNFHLAGIIEKFRAAEREKQRAEEELEQRQVLEQIEQSRREKEEQENRQRQQQHQQVEQQHQENRNQKQQEPTSGDFDGQATSTNESLSSISPAGVQKCKKCPFPGVIHCAECGEDFCLECQQTHSHGESTIRKEFHSEELLKTASDPPSCGQEDQPQVDGEQQQRLQQLQQKQQHLQLELAQQQALSGYTPAPEWQRQQSDRWEELHEKQAARRQVSEDYPPQHRDDMPQPQHAQEPLSWPLSHQTQQVYQHQDLSYKPHTLGYPYPEQQEHFSPPPSMTPTSSQLTCSHCPFPAATHCEQCSSYFCWECKGDLHDLKSAHANHNIVELMHMASLSSPCTFGPEQDVNNYSFPPTIPLIQMTPATAIEVPTTSMTGDTVIYKIPYTCDIRGMGPGKKITVVGQPYDRCSRFHINLMCSKNLKSGDIALHFNPRLTWPKMVVRNTRISGKYGSEERGGPSPYPFKAGRPFGIEFTCLFDKFKVVVDGKPFITYTHRIKDLQSIKYLNVNGDVQITSMSGCM
ncbi:uncharacterized protein LOC119735086, partial [Patiria miniata]|uniref:RING-type domain-containing protein n=1 Tax=Patiria miniata TaxID=46514 RepID=A0A914AMG1_PATMI